MVGLRGSELRAPQQAARFPGTDLDVPLQVERHLCRCLMWAPELLWLAEEKRIVEQRLERVG